MAETIMLTVDQRDAATEAGARLVEELVKIVEPVFPEHPAREASQKRLACCLAVQGAWCASMAPEMTWEVTMAAVEGFADGLGLMLAQSPDPTVRNAAAQVLAQRMFTTMNAHAVIHTPEGSA